LDLSEKLPTNPQGKSLTMTKKWSLTGWAFLIPAALLIAWMNFYPMLRAFILSMQTGPGARLQFADPLWYNYARMFKDEQFLMTLGTTFIYLIVQVPIMLILALVMANLLNNKKLRFKGLFRTMIFLPCATSLVSYSLIFRTIFANNGFINTLLMEIGIFDAPYSWLSHTWSARIVLIVALVWRWTGYNMVFYLAALQNLDYATFEAARIDGASSFQLFTRITIPQLRPMILLTAIMSTNGTLQLFDESWNLTYGGPAGTTMTMSHYLYELSFQKSPNFGYAAAISYVILILVAVLALVQMRVGDKR
jgi:lactose/L-arabinose transport system permease protein